MTLPLPVPLPLTLPQVRSTDELWTRRLLPHLKRQHGASERDLLEFRQLVSTPYPTLILSPTPNLYPYS